MTMHNSFIQTTLPTKQHAKPVTHSSLFKCSVSPQRTRQAVYRWSWPRLINLAPPPLRAAATQAPRTYAGSDAYPHAFFLSGNRSGGTRRSPYMVLALHAGGVAGRLLSPISPPVIMSESKVIVSVNGVKTLALVEGIETTVLVLDDELCLRGLTIRWVCVRYNSAHFHRLRG